ncbi:TRAP transporter large permease [Herbivorax sp. ANBcel31]|uniref:TRAP transporter large permease n=1 Tax=Herbivorax sp. ANBcel31 TaxID=3069754 RepID=UPI0027B0596E|nr:TRAP transporter large permease [Herbivorax sp. ANBcel31]MDQ2086305.1 TRAP transporter large permease [Herbivorax sp. ANBcel31]
MSPPLVGLIGVLIFFVLIAFKVPIAFSMLIVGFSGFAYLRTPNAAFSMVSSELFSTFSSNSLGVIPMFVWMGFIAYYAGIGSCLYNFSYRMIGHRPGGLAISTQIACAVFGAICGSNSATAATMGAIALPEMRKYKYDDSLSTASVAAAGALGVLIPPSVIFIVYGVATEQPIGKLFIAGIIPGLLLMSLYMITIYILVKRNPSLALAGEKSNWNERIGALKGGLFEVLLTFSISLGFLFKGWISPTEAGAIGAGIILFITLIRRRLSWEGFKNSLKDTTRTTAMIMLMVAGAIVFGRFIAISRLPFEMASWASELVLPSFLIVGIILLIYMVLGCFIDALALILLTIPIFYPVVVGTLNYDPIWFGVIIVMVVAMGVITPPVGMNVFIIKGVAKDIPLETIYKGVWPFLIAIIVCLTILIAFPQLVTFLPNLITY